MQNRTRTVLSFAFTALIALTGCNNQQEKQKAAAATDAQQRAAALKAMQSQQIQATEAEKEHAAEFQQQVERNKKKSKAMNKGSDVWRTYVP